MSANSTKMELCRCLLSKGMLIDVEPDPTVPNMSSGLFWCVRTMTCLGPDRKVADADHCGRDRVCFEGYD